MLVDELYPLQQKDKESGHGYIFVSRSVSTSRQKCEHWLVLCRSFITTEAKRKGGQEDEGSLPFPHNIVETCHPGNIADIHRFANFDLCKSPAKRLHCLSGRDKGYCPDRCRNTRSMRSPDQMMELDRGCRGWIPSRLGSNMFVRLPLSFSPGSKLRWR